MKMKKKQAYMRVKLMVSIMEAKLMNVTVNVRKVTFVRSMTQLQCANPTVVMES